MMEIPIQRVKDVGDRSLPIFRQTEKILRDIQERAFGLFARRGFALGDDLADWLTAEREICWPATDFIEHEGDYEIMMALPGYEPSEIEVTATPRELLVHAAVKSKQPEEATKVVARWSSFADNDVFRRVQFDRDIDVSRVSATLKNGMLSVAAPKAKAVVQKVLVAAAA